MKPEKVSLQSFNIFRHRTVWTRALLGVGILMLGWAGLASGEEWIIHGGEANAEIVIADEPARMTVLAAAELQDYLEKISGARLPIVTEASDDKVRIYVGKSAFTDEMGLDTEGLAYGAFRMDSGDGWLALLGPDADFEPKDPWGRERTAAERARIHEAWDQITGDTFWNPLHSLYMHYNPELDVWAFDDRGTLHAVHEYLRRLGVRWYYPGELGEVVPEQNDIRLPVDLTEIIKPEFPVRSMGWWYMFLPVPEDDARWRLRLGLHPGHDVVGLTQRVHGMKYAHMRPEFREAHPEMFAVWSGERAVDHKNSGAPCLSSEELFEKHVAYVRAVLDHFDEPMVSIDIVDGYGRGICECELCQGKGTPERGYRGGMSDYVWTYLNRVAEAVYESHPDRMLSGLSYGSYTLPPETIEQMSPNLAMILMSPRTHLHDPARWREFEELVEAWDDKLPSGQFFLFENVMYNREGKIPVYPMEVTTEFLDAFGDRFSGFLYSTYEHLPSGDFDWDAHAVAHLDIYLLSRLWWDNGIDVDELLEEYYEGFFGPAASEMRAFIEYSQENYPRMRNEVEAIDQALELIAQATAVVEPGSVYAARIGMVGDYVGRMGILRDQLTQERQGPQVVVPHRAADQIVLDGRLDDPFWEGVPMVELRERETGETPSVATFVGMAWGDNDSLYVGIRCEEPDMGSLHDAARGGIEIFNGDVLELLVETPVHNYYQVALSPSGAMVDLDRSRGLYDQWASGARVAVHHGDDYWSVEIQLPAAGADARDLDPNHGVAGVEPVEGEEWFFNLGRNRPRGEETEYSVYAVTGDRHFHDRFIRGSLRTEGATDEVR